MASSGLDTVERRNRGRLSLLDGSEYILVKWYEKPKIQHAVALYSSAKGDGKHAIALYVGDFVGTAKLYENRKLEQVERAFNNVVKVLREYSDK